MKSPQQTAEEYLAAMKKAVGRYFSIFMKLDAVKKKSLEKLVVLKLAYKK